MYFTAVTSNEQNITYYKLFEDFVPELLEKYKEEKWYPIKIILDMV